MNMTTFQGMRMKTEYMMQKIKEDAIDETFSKWEEATRNYYTIGYDNGETTKLYKELEKLGCNMTAVFERDLEIRDEVRNEEMSMKYKLYEYIKENFNVDTDGLKIIWNVIDWTFNQSMDKEDTISSLVCMLDGFGIYREEIESFIDGD